MSLETLTILHPEIRVKHSEEFSFSDADYSEFFDADKSSSVETSFSNIKRYLGLPYIIDSFLDHNQRRAFREILDSQILETYGNNALRVGRVNTVELSLQILSRLYVDKSDSGFFDKVQEIRNYIANNFRLDYDSLTSDLKIGRAFRLKERVASLLNYLEVKKDTSVD